LVGYAKELCGVTAAVQGIQTAERPVFKDTQAQLEESNKKFKNMIDNIRAGVTDTVYMMLELFAQYQPEVKYQVLDAGKWVDRSVQVPLMNLRDGLDIDLAASTEILSQEMRRQMNIEKYTMLSDYMSKLAGMVQMLTSPQAPSDFKMFVFEGASIGAKLLKQILLDMDSPEAESLILDLDKIMDRNKLISMSPDLQPAMPPGMGPDGPTGPGGGGEGGPGGPPPQGQPSQGPQGPGMQ
jgi:hypothetical protein